MGIFSREREYRLKVGYSDGEFRYYSFVTITARNPDEAEANALIAQRPRGGSSRIPFAQAVTENGRSLRRPDLDMAE